MASTTTLAGVVAGSAASLVGKFSMRNTTAPGGNEELTVSEHMRAGLAFLVFHHGPSLGINPVDGLFQDTHGLQGALGLPIFT